ncbi:type II toxin-antitoxin system RelE family toxin [Paraburkholderia sp. BCC1886]|uniref:type II toxin-antitoxin system RelE family toxin n=1 Tax=Paraburkholderia sp. BCC1886 TaxID=2562670 RepID=UPI00118394DF|nr:type II toxin-antitoxin system RelE/ParE family toxin [Paraburkholderia sp. BCC1886]
MTYKLIFQPSAKKEWDKLDGTVRRQLGNKLKERLEQPRVPASALHGLPDCYKIKLRALGYRLVYQVKDEVVTVLVLAIGRRDSVYVDVQDRLPE